MKYRYEMALIILCIKVTVLQDIKELLLFCLKILYYKTSNCSYYAKRFSFTKYQIFVIIILKDTKLFDVNGFTNVLKDTL